MENNSKKDKEVGLDGLKEHLKDTYRIVVTNDETFEEISSYRMTQMNIYSWIAAAVCGVAVLTLAAILFTPLKTLIPGYADYSACLLYTSPSPRDRQKSRMPSSA